MLFFGLVMILNKLIGQLQFFFARLWFGEDIHHSSILKLTIKKAIQKSTHTNLSSKLFQDDSNYEKKSVSLVCVFTQKGPADVAEWLDRCLK